MATKCRLYPNNDHDPTLCPGCEKGIKSMKPKLIVIIGRKWFHKGPGNTYHDAEIIVHGSGKAVIQHRTDYDLGYGEGYVQTASAWLEAQGIVTLPRYANGSVQPLWQYCHDHGIKLVRSEMNVASRSELKGTKK